MPAIDMKANFDIDEKKETTELIYGERVRGVLEVRREIIL